MKKVFAVSLVFLILATMLAACGATPEPQTVVQTVEVEKTVVETVEVEKEVTVVETVEVEKEVTVVETVEVEKEVPARTIVMSSEMFAPPAEQEFFINEVLKPFEEETGITVNFQIIAGEDMFDRVTVQQETGHVTTDVILAFNGRFAWWTDAGFVEPLDEAVAGFEDRTILPAFDGNAVVDGTRYFVPISADVYLTIAHNDALQYLPEGVDLDALTYEDYADWAVAIAEGEGEGKVCITGIPQKMWIYQFGTSALAYGLNPAGQDPPAFPDVNSDASKQAWEQWAKIGAADGFMPAVLSIDNCTDPLMREEAWLSVTHNARVGQVYASNETMYTVAPAPSGTAGIGTIAGAHGVGVVKGSANADAAALLLEYLTRPEVQVKINKGTGGFIPVVAEALDFLGDDPTDEIIRKALLVLEKGNTSYLPVTDFEDWGAVKKVFDDVFTSIILDGDGTVDPALLDDFQAQMDAIRIEE